MEYIKTEHFKLVDATDTKKKNAQPGQLAVVRDEDAEWACVEVNVRPFYCTKEEFESATVEYGLRMDSGVKKDEYVKNLIDVLEDALIFAKEVRNYLG